MTVPWLAWPSVMFSHKLLRMGQNWPSIIGRLRLKSLQIQRLPMIPQKRLFLPPEPAGHFSPTQPLYRLAIRALARPTHWYYPSDTYNKSQKFYTAPLPRMMQPPNGMRNSFYVRLPRLALPSGYAECNWVVTLNGNWPAQRSYTPRVTDIQSITVTLTRLRPEIWMPRYLPNVCACITF